MPAAHKAIIVVDLAFGDCGKGTIVDFLTRHEQAHLVVRFNGGPQAGHNVLTSDGRHHTFAQFGSGTFIPGVRTLLSRFMLIEPYALMNEAAHLAALEMPDVLSRLMIDQRCMMITPAHQAANRLRELARGKDAHGTCGMGIGECMQDSFEHPDLILRAKDLPDRALLRRRLEAIARLKRQQLASVLKALQDHPSARPNILTLQELDWLDTAVEKFAHVAKMASIVDERAIHQTLNAPGAIIFEGAQGVLLDQTHGFHPHTTWSDTTFANAENLLRSAAYSGEQVRIGALRTYFTRHGPGPFVTEDPSLAPLLPEPHNSDAGWQGQFRVGIFDCPAARYALNCVGGVDALAISHTDRLPVLPKKICTRYTAENSPFYTPQSTDPDAFLKRMSDELTTRIGLISTGPTATDKRPLL